MFFHLRPGCSCLRIALRSLDRYDKSGKAEAWAAANPAGANKRKKDPNAPTRSLSAYFFCMKEVRAAVKKELGDGASIGDIGKALGKKWGKLSDKDKKPYQAMNAKDKKRYAKAKAKYDKSGKAEAWAAAGES